MKQGDRVRITETYGERFPMHSYYVGREGSITIYPFHREQYVEVQIDGDKRPGLFLYDEIAVIH